MVEKGEFIDLYLRNKDLEKRLGLLESDLKEFKRHSCTLLCLLMKDYKLRVENALLDDEDGMYG